jgi:hypothetical protein
MGKTIEAVILTSVKHRIPSLDGERRIQYISWILSAVMDTNPIRPKMNMRVVIANMNILGGDDNKPGLPLGKWTLRQCAPTSTTRAWMNLTRGCRQR